jgi:tyrosinase
VSETSLCYWREDPLFNEHHEHWHLVYRHAGQLDRKLHTTQELLDIADKKKKPTYLIWNPRHGELFAYMHSQLLARYAAERLSAGLATVVPLNDYRRRIPEGYVPNLSIQSDGKVFVAANRPDNTKLQNVENSEFSSRPGAQISSQERFRDRLRAAVDTSIANNRPTTISELAERIEATERLETSYFGALHNDGHILISMHDDDPNSPGCMFWEATAVRDPVFYRWHAHIDKFFRKYQDALDPYDFTDLPAVEVNRLTIAAASGHQDELLTEMRARALRSNEEPSVITNRTTIKYLSHEDFNYEITATNKSAGNLVVTVRIFMAPEQFVNDRTAWIEMDKFRQVLPSGESTFKRHSRSSSVVRHPAWTGNMLEGLEPGPNDSNTPPGCRCGWPYTLLLPRGKVEGLPFRFIALLTPGTDLSSASTDEANSASYCGLVDSKYPDERPMGFPFDRPFPNPIKRWIAGRARPQQLISTLVNIKHIDRTAMRS